MAEAISKPPAPGTYPTTCPECGEDIWDRDSAENAIRRHWPRTLNEVPEHAKAAVRKAYLRGAKRAEWTVGDLAADAEAARLGVVAVTDA